MALKFVDIPCPECGSKKVCPRWVFPSDEYFCTDCHHYFTFFGNCGQPDTDAAKQPPVETIDISGQYRFDAESGLWQCITPVYLQERRP